MKFDVNCSTGEIRLTLTENLTLLEGQSPLLESPAAQEAFALLPQFEALARQFLCGFVEDRAAEDKSCRRLDRQFPR